MGIALFHLALVTAGAATRAADAQRDPGTLGVARAVYGAVTGASFNYSFFTPGIFNELQVHYEITDAQGRTREVPLLTGQNKEADLRTITIYEQFREIAQDVKSEKAIRNYRRSISASFARLFFRRYPEAKKVTVRIDNYEPVTIEGFRQGKKPQISLFYRAQFTLDPRDPT
jgi:hypothetical protein